MVCYPLQRKHKTLLLGFTSSTLTSWFLSLVESFEPPWFMCLTFHQRSVVLAKNSGLYLRGRRPSVLSHPRGITKHFRHKSRWRWNKNRFGYILRHGGIGLHSLSFKLSPVSLLLVPMLLYRHGEVRTPPPTPKGKADYGSFVMQRLTSRGSIMQLAAWMACSYLSNTRPYF